MSPHIIETWFLSIFLFQNTLISSLPPLFVSATLVLYSDEETLLSLVFNSTTLKFEQTRGLFSTSTSPSLPKIATWTSSPSHITPLPSLSAIATASLASLSCWLPHQGVQLLLYIRICRNNSNADWQSGFEMIKGYCANYYLKNIGCVCVMSIKSRGLYIIVIQGYTESMHQ